MEINKMNNNDRGMPTVLMQPHQQQLVCYIAADET